MKRTDKQKGRRAENRRPYKGGEYEIRTREGVNPTRFPSVRHRPLGEFSNGTQNRTLCRSRKKELLSDTLGVLIACFACNLNRISHFFAVIKSASFDCIRLKLAFGVFCAGSASGPGVRTLRQNPASCFNFRTKLRLGKYLQISCVHAHCQFAAQVRRSDPPRRPAAQSRRTA